MTNNITAEVIEAPEAIEVPEATPEAPEAIEVPEATPEPPEAIEVPEATPEPPEVIPAHPLGAQWKEIYIETYGEAPESDFTELSKGDKTKIINGLNKRIRDAEKAKEIEAKEAEKKAKAEEKAKALEAKEAEKKAKAEEKAKALEAKEAAKGEKLFYTQADFDQIALDAVEKYNELYSQVTTNGNTYICRESTNQLGKKTFELFKIKSFKEHTLNAPKIPYALDAYGNPKYRKDADIWLEHQDKRFYQHGITFYPSDKKEINGKLNRYFGLGVEPVQINQGNEPDLKTYLEHTKHVICNGNTEHYEYVIKWLAHMIQKPWEKPEVALVLKAGQGTGKGSFMKPLGLIIGAHYIHPQSAEHVVGRFNSLMECSILVFADEFFAGNKGVTDKLKGMITERTTTIERKGIDTIEVPSYSRIIMASNHDNPIGPEKDERRYFFGEVSEDKKGDREYFNKLHDAIGENGSEKEIIFAGKLLSYLQSLDITGWHPRDVPKTDALTSAKMDNLNVLDSWIYLSLSRGRFSNTSAQGESEVGFETRLSTNALLECLEDWEKTNRRAVFGNKSMKVGKLMSKLGVKKIDKRVGADRYMYEFPEIDTMRKKFEEYLGFKVEW